MKTTLSKSEIQSFAFRFKPCRRPTAEVLPIGIPEVDQLVGGLPRGAITEIVGPASSGRTTLLHSLLAASTISQEVCALVDASDSFDATSAAAAGVDFDRLLWVRCRSNPDHAIKAADLLLHSGGFGLVVLDLGDLPSQRTRRIQLSWWFRFRRAIEHTPTALLVISSDPNARSCASLVMELSKEGEEWARGGQADLETPTCANLLGGLRVRVDRRRPAAVDKTQTRFRARRSY